MKKILEVRGQRAKDILGILKCVATADGTLELHEIHKATLHAMSAHLFQSEIDVEQLDGSIAGAADSISAVATQEETSFDTPVPSFLAMAIRPFSRC